MQNSVQFLTTLDFDILLVNISEADHVIENRKTALLKKVDELGPLTTKFSCLMS